MVVTFMRKIVIIMVNNKQITDKIVKALKKNHILI